MDYQTKVNNCTHCEHGNGIYSLSIHTANHHLDVNTWGYDLRAGIEHNVTLFDMTPELMYELAGKIIDTANKIVSENNKGVEF